MQKLYAAKATGSVAPQALLTHLDAPFELVTIDFDAEDHLSPEFLAINPRGQVPTLVLDDGTVLTESMAIMLHIADCYPQAGMIPAVGTSARAQTYRWMAFLATNIYEGELRFLHPESFTTGTGTAEVTESGRQALHRAWGILNNALA